MKKFFDHLEVIDKEHETHQYFKGEADYEALDGDVLNAIVRA